MRNELFSPKWEPNNTIQEIPLEHFYQRDIKAIIIDVDGTLLPRSRSKISTSVFTWVLKAKETLNILLVSNYPHESRISTIAKQLELNYIHNAKKPRKESIFKALDLLELDASEVAIIGDRIFTDILGGNRVGLHTILVKPINSTGHPKEIAVIQNIEKAISKIIEVILL